MAHLNPESRPIRVLHVMPSMHPGYGGPVAAMPVIAQGLQLAGVSVDVVTIEEERAPQASDVDGWQQKDGFRQLALPGGWPRGWMSWALDRWLRHNLAQYELVHVHGVFTSASLMTRRRAIAAGVPFILRPLGILNRWGMERRRPGLKKIVFKFLEKPLLDRAAAIHFTSEQEAADVARLRIKAPSVVIPLGLDLDPYRHLPSASIFAERFLQGHRGPVVLFLSRIDEKKGVDLLLPAFQKLLQSVPDATLVIVGDGKGHVVRPLVQMAADLGLQRHIVWTGFLEGEARLSALAAATVFCLPSRSENFGMALLEAMAAGLPCVTTAHVALGAEASREGAVHLADLQSSSLGEALVTLLADDGLRVRMAQKASLYAATHHSKESVGHALRKLYEQVLASTKGTHKRPASVHFGLSSPSSGISGSPH